MTNQNNCYQRSTSKLSDLTRLFLTALSTGLCVIALACQVRAQTASFPYGSLTEGKVIHGFRTSAIYLNNDDKPMGARFVHAATGLTLDLLEIQSVPQAMIAVNTFPVSDRGEPHTQEHLLIAKGNKGRELQSFELMSLVSDSAYTSALDTVYQINTTAGPDTFYLALEKMLDALIHPDYTEEEVRREVRNFGVSDDGSGKGLKLVEKGSVYNEMTSTFTNPYTNAYGELRRLEYGASHPIGFVSGGSPEGIRVLKPEHIKQFHEENYHLGNMTIIVSHPREMPLDTILARSDAMLRRLEPDPPKRHFKTRDELPAAHPGAAGTVAVVPYPSQNEQQSSPIGFGWPAQLKLPHQEFTLFNLFVANLAGDATTNLYKKLIDTKTREVDVGAQALYSGVSANQGQPVTIWVADVPAANITEATMKDLRARITAEIARIASWKDGSPELIEFNGRLRDRIMEQRRDLAKFVNSPPRFGFRNTGSGWLDHLDEVNKTSGFRKSVTLKSELADIKRLLDGKQNIWRDRIAQWKLASSVPYAVGARPSADLAHKQAKQAQARGEAEVARLAKLYGISDGQEAIRKYRADYDAVSVQLNALAAQHSGYHFIDNPPLTLDGTLDFHRSTLPGGVPMVASTFDNMTSATVGLALRLDEVPDDELVYLSVLPDLLRNSGVIADGHPMSYEEMSGRIRREILYLDLTFDSNYRTERAEMLIVGSGNNLEEARKALAWMKLALFSPNWTTENLSRIRDVIDQSLASLRTVMQQAEENWVISVHDSYRRQGNGTLLATAGFFTTEHNYQRLRWMLMDAATPEARAEAGAFLDQFARAGSEADRSGLKSLLAAMQKKQDPAATLPEKLRPYLDRSAQLSVAANHIAVEAAKDMEQSMSEVPDDSLANDWASLAGEMRRDLQVTPPKALERLNAVRQRILKTANARMYMVGAQATQQEMQPGIAELIAGLSSDKPSPVTHTKLLLVKSRLQSRMPEAKDPVYVGLVSPTMQKGVFVNSAPTATLATTDREILLKFLAARLYSGGGAHGVFSKTIAAGLAYSNGITGSTRTGLLRYYAERVPELPQTLKFVIDLIRHAERDPGLVEYAIATVFGDPRPAGSYEGRAAAMAADFVDGQPPEIVERFFRAILELRKTPGLADELFNRMPGAYASVLPGFTTQGTPVPGGTYLVIGSPQQLDLYQKYLQSSISPETRLYKIYPRDFWVVTDF
jgi:Zn-dependent M16 (insulinase) family peptidase